MAADSVAARNALDHREGPRDASRVPTSSGGVSRRCPYVVRLMMPDPSSPACLAAPVRRTASCAARPHRSSGLVRHTVHTDHDRGDNRRVRTSGTLSSRPTSALLPLRRPGGQRARDLDTPLDCALLRGPARSFLTRSAAVVPSGTRRTTGKCAGPKKRPRLRLSKFGFTSTPWSSSSCRGIHSIERSTPAFVTPSTSSARGEQMGLPLTSLRAK